MAGPRKSVQNKPGPSINRVEDAGRSECAGEATCLNDARSTRVARLAERGARAGGYLCFAASARRPAERVEGGGRLVMPADSAVIR